MTAAGASRVIAERVNFLFDVIVRGVEHDTGSYSWTPYSNEELGRALQDAVEDDEPRLKVERIRSGEAATPEQIHIIAAFFEVDPAFFGDDETEISAIYHHVLDRALQECGVRDYRICRISRRTVREQLRKALPVLRSSASSSQTPIRERHTQNSGSWRASMTGPLSEEQIKTICRNLIVELSMTPPIDPLELCSRLGALRGRKIKLKAADLGSTTSVGHVAPQRRCDRIIYDKAAPKSQQSLVIFHEIIHLIRDHLDGEPLTCGLGDPLSGSAPENVYSNWKEWEAELGARTLARISRERPLPNQLSPSSGDPERNIAAAFGFETRGHR